jgi:hypothetical protein
MGKREKRVPSPAGFGRRDALKLFATGAGVAFLPTFGLSRAARANLRAGAPARNLLVVDCIGAMRSSAAFYASSKTPYNPYGVIQDSTPFPIGRFLDDSMPELGESPPTSYELASWNGLTMPSLKQLAAANGFSIVNTWDPGSGDHLTDLIATTTGDPGGSAPGLLTRVYAGLADATGSDVPFPSFLINDQGATFGKPGDIPRYVPVGLSGAGGLPGAATGGIDQKAVLGLAGNDWAASDAMRAGFDPAVMAERAATNYDLAQVFALQRQTSHAVGGTLAQSFVNVANPSALSASYLTADVSPGKTGQMVPLTNQMLYDAFTNTLGTMAPSSNPNLNTAMNAAIAVRLLQLGSRAIVLDVGNYDAHSGEVAYRPVYALLGRLWGALAFVLGRVPDPGAPGHSLLDTTLVCTMSEFGRDPGGSSGYNGGGGCDHGSGPSTWSQAHAVMGAGVKGGKVYSAVSTDDYRGDLVADTYDAPTFLATLLYAMGIDPANVDYGFEGIGPLPGLWT